MAFLIGSARVNVIAMLFILTVIPEPASSELTIRVEQKPERKDDEAVVEQSNTEQPESPESKEEGPTTLESTNGEPTTPEPTEGTAETTVEGTAETTAEGTAETTAAGTTETAAEGNTETTAEEGPATTEVSIELTSICYGCAFQGFGRRPSITTPVPEIPTEEAVTEMPPTITPISTIPNEEAVTELPPTITPIPTIPTEEAVTELPPTITPIPTIPTEEPVTELPPTITPIPTIPTEEPVTEETEPSVPATESPPPPEGPVTEDECSTFGTENKEPPEHCFNRTLRPPSTMKPLPPPKASEKPDVGLTEPPVVSTKGYPGGEITPPPTHCPPNEVYRECDFLCQPSCKRLKRPKKCPYICIPRCLCKKPLVRRESDGKCIHRSMCPKCKKPNKPDGCPPCRKCKKPKKKPDGFLYDRNIFKPPTDNRRPPTDQRPQIYPRIDQKPPTDQRPQIYPRIDQKPPTDQRPPIYPPIDQGPPYGQFGLSTDYEGPPSEEFYTKRQPTHQVWKKCPPLEVFSMCAGACQATCRQPRRKCARGCICRKPFVRREADGKCVPRSKCHCKKRKC